MSLLGPIPLERLLPAYRDYDIFVLPTLPGEGIPRVLLEAMAAGLPVVVSRVSGIPSLVTHETNETAQTLYNKVAERAGFIQYRKKL